MNDNKAIMLDREDQPPERRSVLRFSLKTLLLLMLLIAVFLGGRASRQADSSAPDLDGDWKLTMPRGYVTSARLTRMEGDRFLLATGGVLSGVCEWRKGNLVVIDPGDERMAGMVWRWDGEQLMLVDEPQPPPTGSNYAGAVMVRKPTP